MKRRSVSSILLLKLGNTFSNVDERRTRTKYVNNEVSCKGVLLFSVMLLKKIAQDFIRLSLVNYYLKTHLFDRKLCKHFLVAYEKITFFKEGNV